MFDKVTCTIPGGKREGEVAETRRAAELPPLFPETVAGVKRIYHAWIKGEAHDRW